MRHVVVLAHPSPVSFNASAAKAYVGALRAFGHEAELRDLYALDFDPRLKVTELPWTRDFAPAPDVVAERALIARADAVCLVYPFWFNAPPAMIKGYVERVFGMGFGYAASEAGGTRPLMTGKSLVSVTTSGAPGAWVHHTGALERLRAGFDDHLGGVLGFSVLDHLHLGGVTPGIRADAAQGMLDDVQALARRLFGPAGG